MKKKQITTAQTGRSRVLTQKTDLKVLVMTDSLFKANTNTISCYQSVHLQHLIDLCLLFESALFYKKSSLREVISNWSNWVNPKDYIYNWIYNRQFNPCQSRASVVLCGMNKFVTTSGQSFSVKLYASYREIVPHSRYSKEPEKTVIYWSLFRYSQLYSQFLSLYKLTFFYWPSRSTFYCTTDIP